MDYREYQLEDFVSDPFFVAWVKNPDALSDDFWTKWLTNNPDKRAIVSEAKSLITSASYKNQHTPSKEDFLQVLEKIHQKNHSKLYQYSNRPKRRLAWVYTIAASVIFLMVFSVFFTEDFDKEPVISAGQMEDDFIVRTVAAGEKVLLTLPDGSEVKINSGSKLWYRKDFQLSRTIYLEGEAFFEVEKDSLHPFKVLAGSLVTEVLGTSFNVNAYPDDPQATVVVAHGVVTTHHKNSTSSERPVIGRGEMVTLDLGANKFRQQQADLTKELAWKEDIIIFDKASFEEVVRKLEKWYGVKFMIPAEARINGKLSGKFKSATLKNVLNGLRFSNNLEFTMESDTVWLKQK